MENHACTHEGWCHSPGQPPVYQASRLGSTLSTPIAKLPVPRLKVVLLLRIQLGRLAPPIIDQKFVRAIEYALGGGTRLLGVGKRIDVFLLSAQRMQAFHPTCIREPPSGATLREVGGEPRVEPPASRRGLAMSQEKVPRRSMSPAYGEMGSWKTKISSVRAREEGSAAGLWGR